MLTLPSNLQRNSRNINIVNPERFNKLQDAVLCAFPTLKSNLQQIICHIIFNTDIHHILGVWQANTKSIYRIVSLTKNKPKVLLLSTNNIELIGDSVLIQTNQESIHTARVYGIKSTISNLVGKQIISYALSRSDIIVLLAIKDHPAKFAGIKDFRKYEAVRIAHIGENNWQRTKNSLIKRGLLTEAGLLSRDGDRALLTNNITKSLQDMVQTN